MRRVGKARGRSAQDDSREGFAGQMGDSLRMTEQLSVVSCQLSVVSCQLSVVSCQLSVVSCQLSVVSCQLSVVSCRIVGSGTRSGTRSRSFDCDVRPTRKRAGRKRLADASLRMTAEEIVPRLGLKSSLRMTVEEGIAGVKSIAERPKRRYCEQAVHGRHDRGLKPARNDKELMRQAEAVPFQGADTVHRTADPSTRTSLVGMTELVVVQLSVVSCRLSG